ncbi:ExbD/TolR family protein [Pseudohalocynthiibacter aestuariivivens]|jgi:biopolymer transport protein ExbD|uniref:ExbD/TolR family protein n=1 Tax=Pseudohalocynthiibacter aestuariivivens TaxID=1591409 RepID=A0ABV5JHY2_9RHOB|nr:MULTISPECIES: biopolymer transporter ExbD [Pseudohalocynthiibacter]MBS9718212.1 biopolymer transporter ExbD [Pseudohalocynthiibacter aestuariivivens]MCK0103860.1 biopolymer transporter ExbD [Pseudohalocynthiibacter sp. F2068]
MFSFDVASKRRRPSLTPMIDVVFLLLVFFMLAARFGNDMQLPLTLAGGDAETAYQGPPRLVDILPDKLHLNGNPVSADALLEGMASLTQAEEDTIILRSRDGASLQRLVEVMQLLREAGHTALVLVE